MYEARESLNDTYYDHSKDAQNDALDAEQSAYEETMNKFIEGMRTSLETATQDMSTFLDNVTTMVSLNAGAILEQYQQTELPLDDALTNPWEAAKKAVGDYSGDALDLMNKWTQEGFFTTTPEKIKGSLTSPWDAGKTAAGAFTTTVNTEMGKVVSSIETNVKTASSKLSALYQQIIDTKKKAEEVDVGGGGTGDEVGAGLVLGGALGATAAQKREKARKAAQDYVDKKGFSEGDKARWGQDKNFLPLLQALISAGGSINDLKGKVYQQIKSSGTVSGYSVSGLESAWGLSWGADDFTVTLDGTKYNVKASNSIVTPTGKQQLNNLFGGTMPKGGTLAMLNGSLYYVTNKGSWDAIDASKKDGNALKTAFYNKLNGYAKGTTGTTRDEWAITDEPQFGDELVLVPGKDGNLSFMRKGTGVVPADMTQKLFELAQIPTSDLMRKNITAIVPDITKNDISNQFNFDSLVHVDHCDQNTLKDLEKMVDNKINDFSKQMNYSLKKFTR